MSQTSPKIVVVTRTYNRPEFLARARKSLEEQTYRDFTWVVVNDGGAGAPVDAEVEKARQSGMDSAVLHLDENLGRPGAANAGVRERAERADAVILLDDDDIFLPNGLQVLATGFSELSSDCVGVAAQVEQTTERWNETTKAWDEGNTVVSNPETGPVRLIDLAYRNFVPVNGFLYRVSLFEQVGGYDETLPVMEDWDFLLKLIQIGDIPKLNTPVARYFVRDEISDGNDPLGNSVAAGHGLHEHFEVILRNRYLRQDLRTGQFGLGILMNPHHRLPMERINAAADGINAVSRRNWFARKLLGLVRKRPG